MAKGYDQILISNPLLDFYCSVNPYTAEIRTKNKRGEKITPYQTAWHKDIRFRIFDTGRVVVDGSLHKYWNNGEHNFNDFNVENVKIVLHEFLNTFKINPKDAVITQLEIGVNIEIPYPIDLVLQNIFSHKKVPFKWTYTNTEGNYYQAEHDQYRIKIYDKTLQYKNHFKIDRELMRVEINFQGVQLRRLYNLNTIKDLINIPFSEFTNTIKKEVENILFFDFTIDHPSQRLLNYSNKNYWQNFINNGQSSSYEKHKNLLKGLTRTHSENVQKQLVEIIDTKSNELTYGGKSIKDICIGGISIPLVDQRTCVVTGFGISMQRSDSRFLSHRGLEFYRGFNYKVFQSLEQRFLTGKWRYSSDKEKIKEIAHNIRNKYHNNKGGYNPRQLSLF